jgi:hypothetical protein
MSYFPAINVLIRTAPKSLKCHGLSKRCEEIDMGCRARLILFMMLFYCSAAGAQPAIIPRLATAPHKPARTYAIVKDYLSDPLKGFFRIIRTNSARHLVIAKRSGIDSQTWNEWAYCKLGPNQMLDTLENGMVTVTVKIDPDRGNLSNISVAADFTGIYGLADRQTTAQCVSRGVLENRILKLVGASPIAN